MKKEGISLLRTPRISLDDEEYLYRFPSPIYTPEFAWMLGPDLQPERTEPLHSVQNAGQDKPGGVDHDCKSLIRLGRIIFQKVATILIDKFRMVLGGHPMPLCFYPLSRVTRNGETCQHQQLRILHTKQIKHDFPSTTPDVFRSNSFKD